jgi:hypothetical protein
MASMLRSTLSKLIDQLESFILALDGLLDASPSKAAELGQL